MVLTESNKLINFCKYNLMQKILEYQNVQINENDNLQFFIYSPSELLINREEKKKDNFCLI